MTAPLGGSVTLFLTSCLTELFLTLLEEMRPRKLPSTIHSMSRSPFNRCPPTTIISPSVVIKKQSQFNRGVKRKWTSSSIHHPLAMETSSSNSNPVFPSWTKRFAYWCHSTLTNFYSMHPKQIESDETSVSSSTEEVISWFHLAMLVFSAGQDRRVTLSFSSNLLLRKSTCSFFVLDWRTTQEFSCSLIFWRIFEVVLTIEAEQRNSCLCFSLR